MSTAPDDERLLDLLLRWEEARIQGTDIPAEELCTECPGLAADLRRLIDQLRALDAPLDTQDDPTPPDPTGRTQPGDPGPPAPEGDHRSGRYRPLRHHAGGGLGDIFVARDEEFNREVALKELRARAAVDPRCRSRFLAEAEITGNLEHPGIVPVYGRGAYADGRPFYAMRLIRGESLKEAILRLHRDGEGRPDRAGRASESRRLLGRFVAVCNAIAYAHSQGVVHRDIKPANIMLGDYGETLVVDWGLAKRLGLPEAAGAGDGGPNGWVAPDEAHLTRPGSVSGTPAFMSTEQARGETDRLGPPSDIYSLGATLYSILTGRAPFEESNPNVLLRRVQEADFPPPRAVRADISPALEAACLKAMAHRPEGRYDSALDLARDIESWLGDEPIRAHREGWGERMARWARRHRAWVRAGVALLLLTTLVAVAAGVRIRKALVLAGSALESEKQARQQEEQQRRAAQRSNAGLSLVQAMTHLEKGDHGPGMLWLARSLKETPPDAEDLHRVIRANLAAWSQLLPLKRLMSFPGRVAVGAVAPGAEERSAFIGGHDWVANRGDYRLWDVSSGSLSERILDLPFGPQALAPHPDGRTFFIACGDTRTGQVGEARIWDVGTGRPAGPALPHPSFIPAAAFSPDGKVLLTGCNDGKARLWDATTGKLLAPPMAHGAPILAVAFSPDGRKALTGSADRTARLWRAATREPVGEPMSHPAAVRGVAFSPDGGRVFTGGDDGTARDWHAGTGRRLGMELDHAHAIQVVAFRPDGRTVLTAGNDSSARLWDAASGRPIGDPLRHQGEVRSAIFSADGRAILTSTWWEVRRWEVSPEVPTAAVIPDRDMIGAVAISPDGRTILAGGADFGHLLGALPAGGVRLWEAVTGRPLMAPIAHRLVVLSAAFSPDGTRFLTGSGHPLYGSGEARLWETATGRPLCEPLVSPRMNFAVAFSPDGRTFLTGSGDGNARLYETATARLIRALRHSAGGEVTSLAFAPDGRLVATGGGDEVVRLWEPTTGRPRGEPMAVGSLAIGLAFSPDGATLATGGADHSVRLWDVRTGRPTGRAFQHQKWVRAVAFSPDGRTLLTGGGDHIACLWDVATGRRLGPPLRHGSWVTSGVFSPDGRRILTGSKDRTARLWDVPTPIVGDAERIVLWTQVATGMELVDEAVQALDAEAWRQRLRRLGDLGGPPIVIREPRPRR